MANQSDILPIGAGVLSSLSAPCPDPPQPRKRIYQRQQKLVRYTREIVEFLKQHRDWVLQRTPNHKYKHLITGRYFWNLRPVTGEFPWIPCQGRSAQYAVKYLWPTGFRAMYRWLPKTRADLVRQSRITRANKPKPEVPRGHFLALALQRRQETLARRYGGKGETLGEWVKNSPRGPRGRMLPMQR